MRFMIRLPVSGFVFGPKPIIRPVSSTRAAHAIFIARTADFRRLCGYAAHEIVPGNAVNKVTSRNVDPTEQGRIDRAARGDRDAQRELFDLHRDIAYATALRITGRHEDALDVVQDAFIKALENLASFQRDAGFRTWLVRIVSNRALDLLRARKVRLAVSIDREDDGAPRGVELAAANAEPGVNLEREDTLNRVRRAVASLPEEHRIVFTLFADAEMSYGEIAEALEIPIGTVMSRLFHARKKLACLLDDLAPPRGKQ